MPYRRGAGKFGDGDSDDVAMRVEDGEPGSRAATLLRWAPIGAAAIVLAAGYMFGLHGYLSWEALRDSRAGLSAFVAANAVVAVVCYILAYVAAVALSFPGASILTIAGGFMFGFLGGAVLALVSATAGATLIFLMARTSLGDVLARKAGPRMQRLRAGFAQEGFSYLLFLRLVPLFPFWLVNLAAALFGIRLIPYIAATAIGIVPGTFVLAYFGAGLENALDAEGPSLPLELAVGLALLGVLTLLPVVFRQRRHARIGQRRTGPCRAANE